MEQEIQQIIDDYILYNTEIEDINFILYDKTVAISVLSDLANSHSSTEITNRIASLLQTIISSMHHDNTQLTEYEELFRKIDEYELYFEPYIINNMDILYKLYRELDDLLVIGISISHGENMFSLYDNIVSELIDASHIEYMQYPEKELHKKLCTNIGHPNITHHMYKTNNLRWLDINPKHMFTIKLSDLQEDIDDSIDKYKPFVDDLISLSTSSVEYTSSHYKTMSPTQLLERMLLHLDIMYIYHQFLYPIYNTQEYIRRIFNVRISNTFINTFRMFHIIPYTIPEFSHSLDNLHRKYPSLRRFDYDFSGEHYTTMEYKYLPEHHYDEDLISYIQNDDCGSLISHITQYNISLTDEIDTKEFGYEQPIYIAAFYGAYTIFKYIVERTEEPLIMMLSYAVHGNNPEIIHYIEDHNDIFYNSFHDIASAINTAIRTHHNDIGRYLINKLQDDISDTYSSLHQTLKYSLFSFQPTIEYTTSHSYTLEDEYFFSRRYQRMLLKLSPDYTYSPTIERYILSNIRCIHNTRLDKSFDIHSFYSLDSPSLKHLLEEFILCNNYILTPLISDLKTFCSQYIF